VSRAHWEALGLGLVHGPVELVPVSSSAHVAAIPWLLRWELDGWDGAARKELEVALHAGTGAALLLMGAAPKASRARLGLLVGALGPPAIAGLWLERPIEQRLRGPLALAGGLLAGATGLLAADTASQSRRESDAGWRDGLWLGAAQACALVPGVSRSGAALTCARARGFDRPAASRLSWEAGLPVLLGAGALKGWRVLSGGGWRERGPALGVAGLAAFASTLATARVIGFERRAPLWPWAVWRAVLAAAVLAVRQNRAR
jgi:undecaprenyl-diphosphatase